MATSNGESAAGVCAKEGADKLKSGGQEEEDVDMAECGEGGVTNGCPENASPDAAERVEGAGSKAVNGSSDHSANEDSRQSEKNVSDIEMNSGAGEDSSKGDNERKEDALDSQLDSSQADGDAVKTESTEASEELPLPDDKPVEKAKEANSGESTPSSTPLRKKKSKKVSKLSIMHAIASRLSGQAKVEPKSETVSVCLCRSWLRRSGGERKLEGMSPELMVYSLLLESASALCRWWAFFIMGMESSVNADEGKTQPRQDSWTGLSCLGCVFSSSAFTELFIHIVYTVWYCYCEDAIGALFSLFLFLRIEGVSQKLLEWCKEHIWTVI